MAETEKTRRKDGPPKSMYIFHMARSPEAHAARRLRPTNRQGFLLSGGTRVRRKGKRRVTQISFGTGIENIEKLIDGVEKSYIKVSLDGSGKDAISLKELESLRDPGALKAWKRAMAEMAAESAAVEKAARLEKEAAAIHARGEALVAELDRLEKGAEKRKASIEKELKDLVAESKKAEEALAEARKAAPKPAPELEPETDKTEVTEGEPEPDTEVEPKEETLQEHLQAMKREELNNEALKRGLKNPEQHKNKAELVEAILAAGEAK